MADETNIEAEGVVAEVAAAAHAWPSHFAVTGVSEQDVAVLAQTIDRPFLRSQRMAWL